MDFCFSGFGAWFSFPIIQNTDTVKVCYTAYVTDTNWQTIHECRDVCEWIVYNGTEWVPLFNTVGINEIPLRPISNKLYDIMGRELFYIPRGTMYIQNRKLKLQK